MTDLMSDSFVRFKQAKRFSSIPPPPAKRKYPLDLFFQSRGYFFVLRPPCIRLGGVLILGYRRDIESLFANEAVGHSEVCPSDDIRRNRSGRFQRCHGYCFYLFVFSELFFFENSELLFFEQFRLSRSCLKNSRSSLTDSASRTPKQTSG